MGQHTYLHWPCRLPSYCRRAYGMSVTILGQNKAKDLHQPNQCSRVHSQSSCAHYFIVESKWRKYRVQTQSSKILLRLTVGNHISSSQSPNQFYLTAPQLSQKHQMCTFVSCKREGQVAWKGNYFSFLHKLSAPQGVSTDLGQLYSLHKSKEKRGKGWRTPKLTKGLPTECTIGNQFASVEVHPLLQCTAWQPNPLRQGWWTVTIHNPPKNPLGLYFLPLLSPAHPTIYHSSRE